MDRVVAWPSRWSADPTDQPWPCPTCSKPHRPWGSAPGFDPVPRRSSPQSTGSGQSVLPVVPRHRRASLRRMAPGHVGLAKREEMRVGARSAVICPSPPYLVQHKSIEMPTQIVVGCYKKGGSSARISIRSSLDENPMSPPSSPEAEEQPSSRPMSFAAVIAELCIPLTQVLSDFFCSFISKIDGVILEIFRFTP